MTEHDDDHGRCTAVIATYGTRCRNPENPPGSGLCWNHARSGRKREPAPAGLLTVHDASEMLGVSAQTVRGWIQHGWLRTTRDSEPACFTVEALSEAHATARWKPHLLAVDDLVDFAESPFRELTPSTRRGLDGCADALLTIARSAHRENA